LWEQSVVPRVLCNGYCAQGIPVRVFRVKFEVPFGGGPVGNTRRDLKWKRKVRACPNASVRNNRHGAERDTIMIIGIAGEVDLGRTTKGGSEGELIQRPIHGTEIITSGPAATFELKPVVRLGRPKEPFLQVHLRVIGRYTSGH